MSDAASTSNNQRLREILEQSGFTPPVALTIFNRGLGREAHGTESWRAFQAKPDTAGFRPLTDELLAHAETVFAGYLKQVA